MIDWDALNKQLPARDSDRAGFDRAVEYARTTYDMSLEGAQELIGFALHVRAGGTSDNYGEVQESAV